MPFQNDAIVVVVVLVLLLIIALLIAWRVNVRHSGRRAEAAAIIAEVGGPGAY